MKIDGSIRSNLLSAIWCARRWRGRQVHLDTLKHWQGVLEHGRKANEGSPDAPVAELVAQLELELRQAKVDHKLDGLAAAKGRRN